MKWIGSVGVIGLVVMAALAACSDPLEDPPERCDELATTAPTAALGTGSVIYAPVNSGDELEIVQGAQGGYHVWGSVRVTGVHPGVWGDLGSPLNPEVQFALDLDEGGRVSQSITVRRPFKVRSDGDVELVGEAVGLLIGSIDDAAWRDARFSISITDTCGTTVSDAVDVALVPAP